MEENIEIVPLEYCGQKVLTTNQIAAMFGRLVSTIQDNFSHHKEEFILGVDYFKLIGEELERFKFLVNGKKNDPIDTGKNDPIDTGKNDPIDTGKNEFNKKMLAKYDSDAVCLPDSFPYLYTKFGHKIDLNKIKGRQLLLFTESGTMKMAKMTKTDKAKMIYTAFRYGLFQNEKTKTPSVKTKSVSVIDKEENLKNLDSLIKHLDSLAKQIDNQELKEKLIRKTAELIFGEEI